MTASRSQWEAIKEGVGKGAAKSASDWIETLFGLKPDKFVEHVAIEVVAALIVAAILGLIGFFASRPIWHLLRRTWIAATFKKTSGTAFVILLCPIDGDSRNAIGNEIAARLETEFRAFAGWESAADRPFEIIKLPLTLLNDEGTRAYDKSIELAKRWLERVDADIIIWGKRTKGHSIGMIRLIGKDRAKGVIEVLRVDFDKTARDFDDALSTAVAYEAARLTQVTLSEPRLASLNVLRSAASKLAKLSRADAPALSQEWRQKMVEEYSRLVDAIARQTPDRNEQKALETAARQELTSLDPIQDALGYSLIALRIAILLRKSNWIAYDRSEIDEAYSFLDKAVPTLEAAGAVREVAEGAIERVLLKRQELALMEVQGEHEDRAAFESVFSHAEQWVNVTEDRGLCARLAAISFGYPSLGGCADRQQVFLGEPLAAFEFLHSVAPYLDNGELIDLADGFSTAITALADRTQSERWTRAAFEVLEIVSHARSFFTREERRLLDSLLSGQALIVGQRLMRMLGADSATPYYDLADRISAEIDLAFAWRDAAIYQYVDLRSLIHFNGEGGCRLDRAIAALRICVSEKAARFPRIRHSAKKLIAVALNNYAVEFGSLEAAQEAMHFIVGLPKRQRGGTVDYVAAFAAWQVARLTSQSDGERRRERGREAQLMAKRALEYAIDEQDQMLISLSHEVLRNVEADFPDLTPLGRMP